MNNQQANRLHRVMLELKDVVLDIDDSVLDNIFDELVEYMSKDENYKAT